MIYNFRVSATLLCFCLLLVMSSGCASEEEKRFTLLSPDETNIDFRNDVTSTPDFNIVNYMYFYDGAGVAAGDINNDGLTDLFFVGNEGPNKLYLNRGDFEFEDVTEAAGVAGDEGAWSTGVTMADVNGNGFLDMYISRVNYLNKSGANQLFINNGDGTFTERAEEYGVDFVGYSTQAVFFDYNNSGRLDLFILNHSFHSEKSYGRADLLRNEKDPKAGDRLFRNDGDSFTDVTESAGIYSSALGYGLGVAVSDINKDGHPDIYVGNDFHENDYLYINNGDGTFTESLYDYIGHTSNASMGNDIADVTNDGNLDIISLDMMPEDHTSFLRSGGPDLVVVEETKKNFGFGNKNARNTMQINRGPSPDDRPFFSEMAFTLGMARTDWSWAALFADLDNSGTNDLFVTNGMVHRPNDLDYVRRVGNFRDRSTGDRVSEEEFESIQYMPAIFTPNYLFRNDSALKFENSAEEWGLNQPSYSSGAVYVDLNNNGMLDLVVNNVNMPAFIYKNNAEPDSLHNFLKVKLNGSEHNTTGIGTKLIAYKNDRIYYREQMPTRGFQSSVDHVIHFGLGADSSLDSLLVIWPDGRFQRNSDIELNRLLELNHADADRNFNYSTLHRSYSNRMFSNETERLPQSMVHEENEYSDFSQEPLIPYYLSNEGPAVAVGDVTGNGLDDIFIGNAHRAASKLYFQEERGLFRQSNEELFMAENMYEDVDATFFDATGNGLLDLYVVSGGGQLFQSGEAHRDRLYINEGEGRFSKSAGRLPDLTVNGSVVKATDIDDDGTMDLFVGGRSKPWNYGQSPEHALLRNDGSGNFENVTRQLAPDLENIGMVTDAVWVDFTGNGNEDLIVVGEWMPITVYENRGNYLENITSDLGLDKFPGLWQSVAAEDLNGDGNPDLVIGNFGTNSRMQASETSPMSLYVNDFNDSGYTSGLITKMIDGEEVLFEQLDELLQEFPQITQQITSYEDFANKTIRDLFGDESIDNAERKQITELRSVAIINRGNMQIDIEPLPVYAQSFPVKAIHILDEDSPEKHMLLGGNHYGVKPSFGGRQDAGYGTHLTYSQEQGFKSKTHQESGFFVRGEIKFISSIEITNDKMYILAGINSDDFQLFIKR